MALFDHKFLADVFGGHLPVRRKRPAAPPRKRWHYGGAVVEADSKSEARSLLKEILGRALPQGAKVTPVAPKPAEAG